MAQKIQKLIKVNIFGCLTTYQSKYIIIKNGDNMQDLFTMMFEKRLIKADEEIETTYLENIKKIEKEFFAILDDEDKEKFKHYKNLIMFHMQEIYDNECKYFLYQGVKFGMDIANNCTDEEDF